MPRSCGSESDGLNAVSADGRVSVSGGGKCSEERDIIDLKGFGMGRCGPK